MDAYVDCGIGSQRPHEFVLAELGALVGSKLGQVHDLMAALPQIRNPAVDVQAVTRGDQFHHRHTFAVGGGQEFQGFWRYGSYYFPPVIVRSVSSPT